MKVTAHVRRSGDWWAVDVPEVDGVFTQAKRLDQVPVEVADAVALMRGIDPEDVSVSIAVDLDQGTRRQVMNVHQLAARADEAQLAASAAMREAVRQLRGAKFSVRDVGAILGISHQRVAQLEGSPDRTSQAGKGSKAGRPHLTVVIGGKTTPTPTRKMSKQAAKSASQRPAAAAAASAAIRSTGGKLQSTKSRSGRYVTKKTAAKAPRKPRG